MTDSWFIARSCCASLQLVHLYYDRYRWCVSHAVREGRNDAQKGRAGGPRMRDDLAGLMRRLIVRLGLTGRGSSAAFSMMSAVLLRCRSSALQQHRTYTRARSFPAAATRPLRIIICLRGSHICLLLLDCDARDRLSSAPSAFGSRPCRVLVSRGFHHACARIAEIIFSFYNKIGDLEAWKYRYRKYRYALLVSRY